MLGMQTKIPSKGGPRPGSGRRPQYPGEVIVHVTIKMTERQREKLRKLGGANWVRERIIEAPWFMSE
jgi:hypothetical protein